MRYMGHQKTVGQQQEKILLQLYTIEEVVLQAVAAKNS